MHLDMSISIGNVIQMGVAIITIVGAYYKLREQLTAINTKLAPLWDEYTDRRHGARRMEDRA